MRRQPPPPPPGGGFGAELHHPTHMGVVYSAERSPAKVPDGRTDAVKYCPCPESWRGYHLPQPERRRRCRCFWRWGRPPTYLGQGKGHVVTGILSLSDILIYLGNPQLQPESHAQA